MSFVRPGGFRILATAAVVLALCGAAAGYWFYDSFVRDLPDLKSVHDFRPKLASMVVDRHGVRIGEYYDERRYITPLDEIPEHTRLAFVAAEDQNFFEHSGIDYVAIARAAWVDLRAGKIKEGASTITMQLVKRLLLSPERKFRRKIREAILATRIESHFSKDEILWLYLNEIYFGHGAWGIGEAARSYFGKPASELTVSESALLAGLPQRPSQYSPFRDPEAAETRRQSVIRRMHSMGAIDDAGAEAAMADVPVLASDEPNEDYEAAGYFTEEVRRYLYERLGGQVVLEGGLVVETTLDLRLQHAAVDAVEDGLRAHDRRYGYRGHVREVADAEIEAEIWKLAEENGLLPPEEEEEEEEAAAEGEAEGAQDGTSVPVIADGEEGEEKEAPSDALAQADAEAQDAPDAQEEEEAVPGIEIPEDELLLGVVVSVSRKAGVAQVAFAPELLAEVHLADVAWAREPKPEQRPRTVKRITDVFAKGDVAYFRRIPEGESKAEYPEEPSLDEEGQPLPPPVRVGLEQTPKVEGALLSLDNTTGDVLAMVGGRDQAHSEFNRATQAQRQPGSSFKPFIYGAALSRSYTPVSILYDRPIVVEDRDSGFVWRPRNYSRHFFGPIPMRRALAKSVNNATVHLFRDVGVDYVIDYARRLGIQSPLTRDLTLALGSSDVNLLELTSAYAVFPNRGRRVIPRFITKVTDREGQVLLEDIALGSPPPPVLKPLDDPRSDSEGEDEEDVAKKKDEGYPDGEILPTDQIISEAEAFLVCDLLKTVVNEGTGRGVKQLGGYLAGKTGTTNDQADAWFMGFSPDVTTGVWVGYDSVIRLGWGETGGKTALPIWRDYMRASLEGRQVRDFAAPDQIVYERVDPETGLLADASTQGAYFQAFVEDTAPTESSTKRSRVTDVRRSLRDDAFQ